MENYIVRIYRRDEKDGRKIAGTVEIIEADDKKPFVGFEELRRILDLPRDGQGRWKEKKTDNTKV
jgi:hypothetical protein